MSIRTVCVCIFTLTLFLSGSTGAAESVPGRLVQKFEDAAQTSARKAEREAVLEAERAAQHRAQQDAVGKVQREAAERTQREAAERAQREATERAQRQAAEKTQREVAEAQKRTLAEAQAKQQQSQDKALKERSAAQKAAQEKLIANKSAENLEAAKHNARNQQGKGTSQSSVANKNELLAQKDALLKGVNKLPQKQKNEALAGAAAAEKKAAASASLEKAESATSVAQRDRLSHDLARQEDGIIIAGKGSKSGTAFRDADKTAKIAGGRPEDWVKKSTHHHYDADGKKYQIHWEENLVTKERRAEKKKIVD